MMSRTPGILGGICALLMLVLSSPTLANLVENPAEEGHACRDVRRNIRHLVWRRGEVRELGVRLSAPDGAWLVP